MKYDIIIGVDPDVKKDGVAILYPGSRKITAGQYCFGETLTTLQKLNINALSSQLSLMVVIEGGWLNSGNWHCNPTDSKALIAAKGVSQGRNHQRGLDLVDFCEYNKIPHTVIKPLQKAFKGYHLWNGKDGKITQEEIESFMGKLGRLNQEGRDAALIAWEFAGLPIRITR